ncbi:pyrimidine/purine nucleoside phosphorylase [Nocardia huaxiensis]|uniref:Pyrimidine/purine nucleoside phosphorylase n=1 Tax=Nocardia huaxiensis TaxID=2755382 RepID=A0A7D6V9T1_9NOCA|nr:pyrimidine/purine nucleoside phosphorylase [Nocardia huaxiensis]QLY29122.1 pyrimidine/purine nucleoside phosphorylase [Nocardia huaxiensis]UFS97385.1 pyrimidine/purine nucleoside phosphorylase [Nocardia huaxiensis]
MTAFENVTVTKKANVYFDGKCVSHSLVLADGTTKSVGVILPATLTFNTGAPEIMELIEGEAKVTLAGEAEAKTYRGGESFSVPGDSSFEIEVLEPVHYVCHFG